MDFVSQAMYFVFKTMDFANNIVQDGGLRRDQKFKQNEINNPLISIITVVLNSEKYLQECLDSLKNQKYKNYEHIVIDGGYTNV